MSLFPAYSVADHSSFQIFVVVIARSLSLTLLLNLSSVFIFIHLYSSVFISSSAGGPSVRSMSTSTKIINGKAVKTTKKSENGQTEIRVEEDGENERENEVTSHQVWGPVSSEAWVRIPPLPPSVECEEAEADVSERKVLDAIFSVNSRF